MLVSDDAGAPGGGGDGGSGSAQEMDGGSSSSSSSSSGGRSAASQRTTKETAVSVSVGIDGTGIARVDTGVKFLDHLLASFAKHAMLDLSVRAESLDGIRHHLVEDTAITVGGAIDRALGDRHGVARFGHASVPLDESLAEATVDLVRRPYARVRLSLKPADGSPGIEDMPKEDVEHFFESLLSNVAACVHLEVRYGSNDHHKAEAAIKSFAVALRSAAAMDARRAGAPSTKGSMQ